MKKEKGILKILNMSTKVDGRDLTTKSTLSIFQNDIK